MNPVLIYKGENICYNVLNNMAGSLGNELEKMGLEVIYLDVSKDGLNHIADYIGREFTAIIGFQTGVFGIFLESKQKFLHDYIRGPKFDFCMDHPIWEKDLFEKAPEDFYVITHDRNYREFIKNYYPGVRDALYLPPGGTMADFTAGRKEQGLVFLGSYSNFRESFDYIRRHKQKALLNRYLLALRRDYNSTPEKVLADLLAKDKVVLSDREFLDLFHELRMMLPCVLSYYRERVVRSLLERDVPITVYGDTWRQCPFADHKNLTIKPAVSPDTSMEELASSKLSLNIMAWHKDGFTERIAGSMLAGSVVVSDRTACLEEQYIDGEEMILFDLKDMDNLADRIKALLRDDEKRQAIADRAYERAVKEDTWKCRAESLLRYIYEIQLSGIRT